MFAYNVTIAMVILKQENYQPHSVLQNRGEGFGPVAYLVGVSSQCARVVGSISGKACAGINQ